MSIRDLYKVPQKRKNTTTRNGVSCDNGNSDG